MASGPIISWHITGETMKTVTDFIFLGYKMTAEGDYSHEIKRFLEGIGMGNTLKKKSWCKINISAYVSLKKKRKNILAPWRKSYDKPR